MISDIVPPRCSTHDQCKKTTTHRYDKGVGGCPYFCEPAEAPGCKARACGTDSDACLTPEEDFECYVTDEMQPLSAPETETL